MSDVTRILSAIERGDGRAVDQLFPVVYEELRQLAARKLAREKPGRTLQTTALVHEAYLRLLDAEAQNWKSRTHFFAAVAEAMRRILVDEARRRHCQKREGGRRRVDLEEEDLAGERPSEDVLAIDEALTALAQVDPVKADVVKLRYFAGLSLEQTAEALSLSPTTVKRHWRFARAWLYNHLRS